MREHPAQLLQSLRASLEDDAPLPREVRQWLRDGARKYARGAPSFDECLGLKVGRGEAWRHPARQLPRARQERLILDAAAGLDGTESARATQIAYALEHFGDEGFDGLPDETRDALLRLVTEFGTVDIPVTRSPLLRILHGDTQAQRDGFV